MHLALKVLVGIGIVLGGVLVNGLVASLEDELPGGFLNPNGDQPLSPGTVRMLRVAGLLTIAALLPVALMMALAALSEPLVANQALAATFACGTCSVILAIAFRRRWLFWMGAFLIALGVAGALIVH